MFDYRLLDDPRQVLSIAKTAFALTIPEQPAVEDWLSMSVRHGRELYGVYEGDQLLAAYMLYDYRLRLRKSVVPMGGIGLLCSRLDARGRGAVRHMLQTSLETMRSKGHVVSVLDPFDETFYRKYGWEKFSRQQTMRLSPGLLQIPDETGCNLSASDLSFPDSASIDFYNEYASRHHSLIQRGPDEWDCRTKLFSWSDETAARGVVRFTDADQIVGLMGYDLTRKRGEYRSTFNVNLLVYLSEAVLREMLRYLKRLSHQIASIRIDLPMDVEIWPYLTHRPDEWTIRDVFMLRGVSLEALDGLAICAPDMTLGIDVDDQQAPWNHRIWELTVDSDVLHVRSGQRADLRCGIGALSSVLSGFASFEELICARLVEPLPSYRQQDLPKTTNFLADYF